MPVDKNNTLTAGQKYVDKPKSALKPASKSSSATSTATTWTHENRSSTPSSSPSASAAPRSTVLGMSEARQNVLFKRFVIVLVVLTIVTLGTWGALAAFFGVGVGGGGGTSMMSRAASLMHVTRVDAARMPAFVNGSEYGVSLWLYVNEFPTRPSHSVVLAMRDVPVIRLQAGRASALVTLPHVARGRGGPGARRPHAAFDYVPARRWVHLLAVHVDGTITLFKDGQLYSVNHVRDAQIAEPEAPVVLGLHPVDAVVSNLAVLDHFPSTNEVKSMYRAGPRTGSGWFGRGTDAPAPCYRVAH